MCISTPIALMRRGLYVGAVSLCLMLSACGHGRVSADAQVQPDDAASPAQPAASAAPDAAQEQSASSEAAHKSLRSDSPDAANVPAASESNHAMIERVVSQHRDKIRYCYERALQHNPTLEGYVVVKLSIAQTGEVNVASVSVSSLKDAGVEDCIVRTITTWRFDEPKGGAMVVHYPFNFVLSASSPAFQTGRLHRDPDAPKMPGWLDKENIRLIIRQHLNEIRYCYEVELQKNPKLAGEVVGEVTVKFTISGTGSVTESMVVASTLNHAEVEACVIHNILTWQFPPPLGSGIVKVTYPFRFSS